MLFSEKKKKVALCISSYEVVNSPSLRNLIEFLNKTYHLTIVLEKVAEADFHFCKNRYVSVRMRRLRIFNYFYKKKYSQQDLIIAVDPAGFNLALNFFSGAIKKVYYSLELFLSNDHFGLDYPDYIRKKERANINKISGLIIQSEERKKLFISDYGVSPQINCFLLPVTYSGSAVKKKSKFLHQELSIPENQKIILHLGGIGDWFSSQKFVDIFCKIDGWALVFHGAYDVNYKKKIQKKIKETNIHNVYISELYDSSMEVMSKVLESSELGLAWYNNISKGFSTAGESSGKIAAYLRYGLPVICKSYPSTKRVIQKNNCGICIFDESELIESLDYIEKNINFFRSNCFDLYERQYNFLNYEAKLKTFFDNVMGA